MALALANAGFSAAGHHLPAAGHHPPAAGYHRRVVAASVREVASWLGDMPAVARGSSIGPRLIAGYESAGELPTIPVAPAALPPCPKPSAGG